MCYARLRKANGRVGGDDILGIADDIRQHLRHALPLEMYFGLLRLSRIFQHPDWIRRPRKPTVFSMTAVCTTTGVGKYALLECRSCVHKCFFALLVCLVRYPYHLKTFAACLISTTSTKRSLTYIAERENYLTSFLAPHNQHIHHARQRQLSGTRHQWQRKHFHHLQPMEGPHYER